MNAASPIVPRSLYLLRRNIHAATAAIPKSAPRDDDAIVPATQRNGSPSSARNVSLLTRFRTPNAKYSEIGNTTHIWIPNSPEFPNHPGAPTTPQSRNWNPTDAHERKLKSAILRFHTNHPTSISTTRPCVFTVVVTAKYTSTHAMKTLRPSIPTWGAK